MKRSEMLRRLEVFLVNETSGPEIGTPIKNTARMLLEEIERAGMAPPPYGRDPTPFEYDTDDLWPQDIHGNKIANEWEPET